MTDERFLRGFRAFDAPVAPDTAFAERLYGQLAGELGFRPGEGEAHVPTESVGGRVRRMLRLDWRPLPPAQMRLVYVIASAALLLAALAGSAFVASQVLRSHPSPLEIVRRSQAAVKDPPAFAMTYRNPDGTPLTLSTDGEGTWRLDEPGGSFTLWDGKRAGLYNGDAKTWGVGEASSFPPFALLANTWAWVAASVPDAAGKVTDIDCGAAEWLGEATVANRVADHIRCPGWHDTEYWIDRETSLPLKFIAGPTTPGWTDPLPNGYVRGIEATSLDLAPNLTAFSWDGPVGAYDENNPPPSTVLAVGAPVPTLAATTVDGAALSLPKPGRPAAVLFSANMARGRYGRVYDAFSAAAAAHPGVDAAIITNEMSGTAAGYRSLHPTTVPLVGDWDNATWQAWGINILGTFVLVDADGNAALMRYDEVSRDGLERLFAALERGDPLPEEPAVTPAPTPTFVPPPEGAVLRTPVGERVPAWKGQLLDGTTFDSMSLAGRPYVLANFAGSTCDTCPVDQQLDAFEATLAALGEQAAFVLVGNGEFEPGATRRLMDRLGIATPVVMDWDGAISDALDWTVMGTIVVDAQGRLVAAYEQFPGEAVIKAALDAAESGQPLPLPTPGG